MGESDLSEKRRDGREDDDHFEDLPDGAGCTEIWEHLSERRTEDDEAELVEE